MPALSYGGSCLVNGAPESGLTNSDCLDSQLSSALFSDFSAPGRVKFTWRTGGEGSLNTFFELISNLRFATTATINSDLTDYYLQSAYLN